MPGEKSIGRDIVGGKTGCQFIHDFALPGFRDVGILGFKGRLEAGAVLIILVACGFALTGHIKDRRTVHALQGFFHVLRGHHTLIVVFQNTIYRSARR